MSSNSKTSVSKAQNEQHKKILSQLLKLECNRRCCDCSARGPTWASVNLGLFVCLNCSGIHRSLGTHLSKVRSTTLDTWLPEQVEFISKLGNVRANNYWEARLPRGFRRPSEGDMSAMKNFIIEKYQNQVHFHCCWPAWQMGIFHQFHSPDKQCISCNDKPVCCLVTCKCC